MEPRQVDASLAVVGLDRHLIVGAFVAEEEEEVTGGADANLAGYLMVVDIRVNSTPFALSAHEGNLTVHHACTPTVLPGGRSPAAVGMVLGQTVSLRLDAGGGQLIGLYGGRDCITALRRVRQRNFHPRGALTAVSYRPRWFTNLRGTGGNAFTSGGLLTDRLSDFLIGGAISDTMGGGWVNEAEAASWAQAGFNVGTISYSDESILSKTLGLAAVYGIMMIAKPSSDCGIVDEESIRRQTSRYGCHPNLIGVLLASGVGTAVNVTAAALSSKAMIESAYWQLPLITSVSSVSEVVALAVKAELPVVAMSLPAMPPPPSTAHDSSSKPAMAWAADAVDRLNALSHAANNRTLPLSMAVSLDACGTNAESLLRFSAYTSILLGAQMVYWDGMGPCAPVGSPKFELIGELNRRISTWAQALFQPVGPGIAPQYRCIQAFTTSSITFPSNLCSFDGEGGVEAVKPGSGGPSDLIQAMDDELLAIVLHNSTQTNLPKRMLLVLSTDLSTKKSTPIRDLELVLHREVGHVVPIEPDKLQGYGERKQPDTHGWYGGDTCPMGWLGPRAPLKLAAGSAQVMKVEFVAEGVAAKVPERWRPRFVS